MKEHKWKVNCLVLHKPSGYPRQNREILITSISQKGWSKYIESNHVCLEGDIYYKAMINQESIFVKLLYCYYTKLKTIPLSNHFQNNSMVDWD